MTEDGEPWTPIGQNDAISWVELNGLFRRRDLPAVERHLDWLAAHGVTCLRLMLEYVQVGHRWIERPAGRFPPEHGPALGRPFRLVRERGLRLLITPFDTFWTWLRWQHHPYNVANGGPLTSPSRILLCPETREAIKGRLAFAVERWGGSRGAVRLGPVERDPPGAVGGLLRRLGRIHRRSLGSMCGGSKPGSTGARHPQTVSLFGPELWWRPHMPLAASRCFATRTSISRPSTSTGRRHRRPARHGGGGARHGRA